MDDRSQIEQRDPDPASPTFLSRIRLSSRLRSLRLTPAQIVLAVAVLGSAAFVVYALTVRDFTQGPLLAAGLGVLGLAFAAVTAAGGIAMYRAAEDRQSGRALVLAVAGGIAGIIAMACFAGAVILARLSRPP